MMITPVNNYSFTSAPNTVANKVIKSKLFTPAAQKYDKLTDWLADNYYSKFFHSKFTHWFADKTKNVKNMTTHMAALGSTLISAMYAVKTLQNDKLDSEKRKTLALNDVLTWGFSTAGSYLIDNSLANWWEGITTKFAANYLMKNPKAKRVRTLGDWKPKNIYEMMGKKFSKDANAKNIDAVIEDAKARGYEYELKDGKYNFKLNGKYAEKINARIDKINAAINSEGYKGLRKPLGKIKPDAITNIRDFNLDILKNRQLTTLIDGMGVLKSLFVFGMVYRYLVPVLVMKPANKIGAYFHKKREENNNTKAA